jgi:hypothetical protein
MMSLRDDILVKIAKAKAQVEQSLAAANQANGELIALQEVLALLPVEEVDPQPVDQ